MTPLFLAVDIGNTNITLGVFPAPAIPKKGRLSTAFRFPPPEHTWRLSTRRHGTADDYGPLVVGLLRARGVPPDALTGVAVASVVPSLTGVFAELSEHSLGRPALLVGPTVRTGVRVRVDNPAEVGADRVVNAAAAFVRERRACIVVDFGTATTFDCVNNRGDYCGGVIAPGPAMAAEALGQRTAQLPTLSVFKKPPHVLGTNTLDSLASGLYHGYVGLTREILQGLRREMGGRPVVLATGGLAPLLGPEIGDIKEIVPHLTLEGLWWIGGLNRP